MNIKLGPHLANETHFKMEPRPISPPPSSFTLYSSGGGGGRLKLQQRRMQAREERWGEALYGLFLCTCFAYISGFFDGEREGCRLDEKKEKVVVTKSKNLEF